MSIKSTLRSNLMTAVPSVGERVYNQRVPAEVASGVSRRPCVVFARTGGSEGVTFCGSDGLDRGVFDVSCYALDADTADGMASAIAQDVDSWLIKVFVGSIMDAYEEEPGLYRAVLSLTVWFRRSA